MHAALRRSLRRRGVSLVELLVVIAIAAAVIAIILVVLSKTLTVLHSWKYG